MFQKITISAVFCLLSGISNAGPHQTKLCNNVVQSCISQGSCDRDILKTTSSIQSDYASCKNCLETGLATEKTKEKDGIPQTMYENQVFTGVKTCVVAHRSLTDNPTKVIQENCCGVFKDIGR